MVGRKVCYICQKACSLIDGVIRSGNDWRTVAMWLLLGCGVTTLTQDHVFVLDGGDSIVLDCRFKSSCYNMFDYPVIWHKQQISEWTQINVMGSVNQPFVSGGNRFELSFTATPPYYVIQLFIRGLCCPKLSHWPNAYTNPLFRWVCGKIILSLCWYLTYGTDVLPPSAEASSGPDAHPELTFGLLKLSI